jgi:hypothetical protein
MLIRSLNNAMQRNIEVSFQRKRKGEVPMIDPDWDDIFYDDVVPFFPYTDSQREVR